MAAGASGAAGASSAAGAAPRFYVLTPTYNRAARLVRAIESVQRQDYPHWEMFVYDDGSTDETPEQLKRFAVDDRIHCWRSNENCGANRARNQLLERILERDEPGYVAMLDDDDAYVDGAFTRLAQEIRTADRPWLIARCCTASGEPLTRLRRTGEVDYVLDHKFGRVLKGEVAHFIHSSLVGDSRFLTSYRNAEEWFFYYELARREKMWAIDFDAVVMEYLDAGLSLSRPNVEHKADLYRLKLERLGDDASPRLRARLLAKLARQLLVAGHRREGRATLRSAFRAWPLEARIYQFLAQDLLPPALGGFEVEARR